MLRLLLAMALACAVASSAVASSKASAEITIGGDFVPDQAGAKPPKTFHWRVPWHPGMTLSTALHDAGIHPMFERAELHIRTKGRSRKIWFPFKKPSDNLPLDPGDHISLFYGLG
jgi:hypothetical protein